MGGFEVIRRDRPDGPIAIDEGVPHGGRPPTEGRLRPQKHRQVVGEVSRTAVVKVEKYGFACVVDPRIEAVTVTMAMRPAQIGEGFNRLCGPRSDVLEIAADLGVFHDAAIAYSGEGPMQQVFEIKPIERSVG